MRRIDANEELKALVSDDIRQRLREDTSTPTTLYGFATFLTAGNSRSVESAEDRSDWQPSDYYQLLDQLVSEMKNKGYITDYSAVSSSKSEEFTNATAHTSEALIKLRHVSDVEPSDEEIIKNWGLDTEIPKAFTLGIWQDIQKTVDSLRDMFGEIETAHADSQLPKGNIVPIYTEGTQEVAPDAKASPTPLFPESEGR